jgi:translocation protein SEC62
MFRRVIKVYKDQNPPSESAADEASQSNTVRQRKNKTTTEGAVATTEPTNDDESKDKNKKKKFKFEMHNDQLFIDSVNDFYIWIYSPTTIKQYLIGGLLVIGCIGVCLFPLWPMQVRTGVYYISIVLASLLAGLLSLAVVKYIIFAMVWFATMGKIKFWLLPNLTEDVGFFESFVPLYILNVKGNEEKKKEVLVENEQENEQDNQLAINRPNLTDTSDEERKRQKLAEEGFEVLSKDELETK